jgi:hypothetical protein
MAAAYETLQGILEEAGLSHRVLGETPYGEIDGSNKLFTTHNKPLTDVNYDDSITIADVLVLVNGTPATVVNVDAQNGTIEIETAPEANDEVLVDYRYSPIALSFVSQLRDEVQDEINLAMKAVDPCAPYDYDVQNEEKLPNPTVRQLCRLLAAAYLLIRDYGFNQDTEGTSKDGFVKHKLVMGDGEKKPGMLAMFKKKGGVCGEDQDADVDSASLGAFQTDSDGKLFGKFEEGEKPNSDCEFC